MSDHVLLRFRDLTAGVNTIEAHNAIAERHGSVLWGWWKKPLEVSPDPGLTILQQQVGRRPSRAFFVDTATRTLYHAELYAVHYAPGGAPIGSPNDELCPDYYEEKELPAWFELEGAPTQLPTAIG